MRLQTFADICGIKELDVDEHATIRLTCQEQAAFVRALLDPQSAISRLQHAAETYLEVTARRAGRDVMR